MMAAASCGVDRSARRELFYIAADGKLIAIPRSDCSMLASAPEFWTYCGVRSLVEDRVICPLLEPVRRQPRHDPVHVRPALPQCVDEERGPARHAAVMAVAVRRRADAVDALLATPWARLWMGAGLRCGRMVCHRLTSGAFIALPG